MTTNQVLIGIGLILVLAVAVIHDSGMSLDLRKLRG